MYKKVLAIGVFDLFHVGHLRYLQYAKQQGLHLAVAVTSDLISYEIKNKYPIVSQQERMEIVASLCCVDEVFLSPSSTEYTAQAAEWIANYSIDLVVAGGGWQGSARWNRLVPALKAKGIDVLFAPATDGISTSDLIKRCKK